jgi:hypothetical protein
MTMRFGKYRGWRIAELPDDYVDWLFELRDLHEPLRSAVDREWHKRFDDDPEDDYAEPDDFPDQDRALFRELIESGYRALALKLHPDRGGSTEGMQRLNALMHRLRRKVVAA